MSVLQNPLPPSIYKHPPYIQLALLTKPILLVFANLAIVYYHSHGSDSKESAEAEIALWFSKAELNEWSKTDLEAWVYE
ncbi:unnamed protein product [Chondrus crispus]|uniref:Uncharacterized protein n=1 Tax=Chondrus crispus TaxID=2769 RepID=R7Q3S5_CHOCR|nr:unnamed protein product [Chondrus crispus]CDF32503.1 unnamed protein product [Chondrus crispus]|eukprot:XP_005712168.1 unnamed protein product [Chondrus crispus]